MAVWAQQPAFYHLSTAEGLSDNNVNWASRDRNGILWIATTEGLNSFDGNRITTYYREMYPQLPENNIARVLVDTVNRIWIRTAGHFVTMLDEKRRFHKIPVGDTTGKETVTSIFLTKKFGLIVLKGTKHYFLRSDQLRFERKELPFEKDITGPMAFTYFLNSDRTVYYRNDKLIVINYNTLQLEMEYIFPGLTAANYVNDDELLLFTVTGREFFRFSISQRKVTGTCRNLPDQYNQPVTGDLRNVTRIDSNRFAFTTFFAGLYLLNLRDQKLEHWMHDPVNPRSIGGNNTLNIRYDTSGYLFVTTQTSGLHFINLNVKQADTKSYWTGEQKELFDGYIQSVYAGNDSTVWLGAQDRLIFWNRKNDQTEFVPLRLENGTDITGRETIRFVTQDEAGVTWVGSTRYGIFVLNKQRRVIAHITDSMPGGRKGLPSPWINAICQDRQGNWWVGTLRGVCKIDRRTFLVTTFESDPVLKPVAAIFIPSLWRDKSGNMWIGSSRGAWLYDETRNTLTNYTTKEGLAHNTVQAINADDAGNIYFATLGGLSVLEKSGRITTYNRRNGLRNDRCDGVLNDGKGYMWIGNLNCITRFDPDNKTITVFDDGIGFSHGGFRMRCAFIKADGELFWGADKGLVYFYPEKITGITDPIKPFVHSLQADNKDYFFTMADRLDFPYTTSSFVFSFSSGELGGDKRNQFRYQLEGFDKEWKTPTATGQAVYGNLGPGHYTFIVKASRDGITWYTAAYPVELVVHAPWWKQTWFRVLSFCVALGLAGIVYLYYQRRRKNRMALLLLNAKMAETRFLNLRLQMNPHFLFNSLSAIQHLIVSQQTNSAYKYLTVFSNFLRSLLNFAEKNFIPLDEEIKILQMYTELESLRFDKSFTWEVTAEEGLSFEEVMVPSLMVQPLAENAIWHGLLHKEGDKKLTIHFSGSPDDYIRCTVEDNGIGRKQAAAIKQKNINSRMRESKGISIIAERLKLLQEKTGKPAFVEITDLYDASGEPAGTRAVISIPYYNPEVL